MRLEGYNVLNLQCKFCPASLDMVITSTYTYIKVVETIMTECVKVVTLLVAQVDGNDYRNYLMSSITKKQSITNISNPLCVISW